MAQWGVDLWDCEKVVLEKFDDNSELLEKCQNFIKEQIKTEKEYVKDTIENVERAKKQMKQFVEKDTFKGMTVLSQWTKVIEETCDMARQHDRIKTGLEEDIFDPMKQLIKTRNKETERLSKELRKIQKDLEKHEHAYQDKKKRQEKDAKEQSEVEGKLEAANKAKTLQKNKITKLEDELRTAEDRASKSKADYIIEQNSVIEYRTKHYLELMNEFLNDVQRLEHGYIKNNKDYLTKYANIHKSVQPSNEACVTEMIKAADTVNPDGDISTFSEMVKTGIDPDMKINPVGEKTVQEINNKRVTKNKLFKTTTRKKDAIREDFGHLPPEQRRRAIKGKLEELNETVAKETKAQDGLEKTVEAYTKNPGMGDEKSTKKLTQELAESKARLVAVKMEIEKFELYLSLIEENAETPRKNSGGAAIAPRIAPAKPSRAPIKEAVSVMSAGNDEEDFEEEDFDDDTDDAPKCQNAACKYDFLGDNEGELGVRLGEIVSILEPDTQGTGWIMVVNSQGQEGYIPASYVEIV